MLEKLNTNWINTHHRNRLQIALMENMLGSTPLVDEEINWIKTYAETIHTIIDNPDNIHIREMILNDKIDQVLPEIILMLNQGELLERKAA